MKSITATAHSDAPAGECSRRPARIGLGLCLESDVREDIESGPLIRVLVDWMKTVAPLCLYYPERKNPSAAFKEFINLAREFTSALNAALR